MRAASPCSPRHQPAAGGRRIAVLGDMLELGDAARASPRRAGARRSPSRIDLVFTVGTMMRALDEALPRGARGGHADDRRRDRRSPAARLPRGPATSSRSRARMAAALRAVVALLAAARRARASRAEPMLYHLLVAAGRPFRAVQPVPLSHVPLGGAVVTALLISFLFGPPIIGWLRSKQGEGQPIRSDGPESHCSPRKARRPWAAS